MPRRRHIDAGCVPDPPDHPLIGGSGYSPRGARIMNEASERGPARL